MLYVNRLILFHLFTDYLHQLAFLKQIVRGTNFDWFKYFLMLHNINLRKCHNCIQSDDASCHEVSDCNMANPFNMVNTQSCDYFEWKKRTWIQSQLVIRNALISIWPHFWTTFTKEQTLFFCSYLCLVCYKFLSENFVSHFI